MNRILIEIKNLEYRSYNSSFVMKYDSVDIMHVEKVEDVTFDDLDLGR